MTLEEYEAAREAKKAERIGKTVLWLWDEVKGLLSMGGQVLLLLLIVFVVSGFCGGW